MQDAKSYYKNNYLLIIYFQRLRESIKPILKKHQLKPGQDLSKVNLDEDNWFDENTETPLDSFVNSEKR